MLIFQGTRSEFYPFLPKNVESLVEFGVFRGNNAVQLVNACRPKETILVDAWSAMTRDDFAHLSDQDFENIRQYSQNYYGGDICQQATYDRIYANCMANVATVSPLTEFSIFRSKTRDFYQQYKDQGISKIFDIAYVDASHQYEDVFWELLNLQSLLKDDALVLLNDVYWGEHAYKQNMGVLQAVTAALQITKYKPLLLTDTPFSDLVLTNHPLTEGSLGLQFLKNLELSKNHIIEVADEALFTYNHHKPSYWTQRNLPSFKLRDQS
jgi:hypothetical protein